MIDAWQIFTFATGVIGLLIFIAYIIYTKKRKPELTEVFTAFGAFASISPGVKLCWIAYSSPLMDQLDIDRTFVFGGGLAVLWISADTIYTLLTKP